LTKWGELVVGIVLMGIGIVIFYWMLVASAAASLLGQPFDTTIPFAFAVLFFLGGILVAANSHESPPAVSGQPASPSVARSSGRRMVSSLGKTILIGLPRGKTVEEISKETGVDVSIVTEKVQNLKSGGFLTEGGKLTQEGFEATQESYEGSDETVKESQTSEPSGKSCVNCGHELNILAVHCPFCGKWQS
jgi:hypothetical protein